MAKVQKQKEQSGMVKHDPKIVTKVRIAVASLPDMTIGKFYDEAVEEKLKSKTKKYGGALRQAARRVPD